jgi:iron complex outermembrane receptor protein
MLLSASAVVLAAVPAPAFAQSASQSPSGVKHSQRLEEIVVTAQRRAQSVQKSSVDIQVLGAAKIQQAGLSQAADLNKVVPGLQVGSVGSTIQVFIRGVGDITSNPLTSPAVAINVDGVYIGRGSAVSTNFYDIARIEVLKGPQGTLYGRNASGGAVNVITNTPDTRKISGYVEVEGGNYNLKHLDAAVNIPLTDTLAMRAAFQVVNRDGYLSDGSDDEKHEEGRIRTTWRPNDVFSLLINADAAHEGGNGSDWVLLPQTNPSSPWTSINSPASQATLKSYPFLPFPATASEGNSRQDNNFYNASAQADWKLDFATLTVLPAFRYTGEDYVSWNGFLYAQQDRARQESLEVRLANNTERLKWVVGGYLFNEDIDVAAHAATNYLFQNIGLNYATSDFAYAGFGEATYSVTDKFRLIGGLRLTQEQQGITGHGTDLSPLTGPRVVEMYNSPDANAGALTWKAGAEYDLAPESLLFATAATGFKAGGHNPTSAPNTFKPEKLTAYTIGSRNRFLADRLQINVEGFYWKYKDKQESAVGITPSGNFSNLTRNAGAATLKGVSVDAVFKASYADTLHLFAEYNETSFDQFIAEIPSFLFNPLGISTGCGIGANKPGNVRLDCAGFPLSHAPKWSGSADADHRFDLPNDASLTADISAVYSSSYYIGDDFTPTEHRNGYVTANASVTYRPASQHWSLTGFVQNFTNKAVYTGGTQEPLEAPLTAANINPPRTYGARLRYSF